VQACAVDPSIVRRVQKPYNQAVREEMQAIDSRCRRFGCNRIAMVLQGKGAVKKHKKLYRRHSEQKLGIMRGGGGARALVMNAYAVALRPGER